MEKEGFNYLFTAFNVVCNPLIESQWIVSGYFEKTGIFVVVKIDSMKITHDVDGVTNLKKHYETIMKDPKFHNWKFVSIIQQGISHLDSIFYYNNLPHNVIRFRDPHGTTVGVQVSKYNRADYQFLLSACTVMDNIRYENDTSLEQAEFGISMALYWGRYIIKKPESLK